MANALAGQRSLYLREHADNPVDWLPWGEEAFRRARERDRPLLISIGYSACHWCHVMARESFSDPAVAAAMNRHFVCVKVDREERPDVDGFYMDALLALRGHGGWPLNVCATPEGKPFFAGTYYPPQRRGAVPSWIEVVEGLAAAWREQREELEALGNRLTELLHASASAKPRPRTEQNAVLAQAERACADAFDQDYGGFGEGAKFPQAPTLAFLEQRAKEGSARAAAMVDRTLHALCQGAIYDHLGGGFHRYTVDRAWRLPHFEKMLYDNALLAQLLTQAYLRTANPLFARRARETLDFMEGELGCPEGPFYASLDSESEGVEGAYYLWRYRDLEEALGELAPSAASWFGVRERGNVPELAGAQNTLYVVGPEPAEGKLIKARLLEARRRRQPPATDEKLLTSWNGLALAALAQAALAFREERYLAAARRLATFFLTAPRGREGLLPRLYASGSWGEEGFLEDHAYFLGGLLALFEASCEERYLEQALALADLLRGRFWDPEGAVFRATAVVHRPLVPRVELQDSALPSGNASAGLALWRLFELTGNDRYQSVAQQALGSALGLAERHPLGFGATLLLCSRTEGEPPPLACPFLPRPSAAA